jgi:hypothetical protein
MKIRGMIIDNGYGSDDYGPVKVDGKVLDPARSQKIVNHSPDGFSWGYSGSGPSQLALAILLEAGCTDIEAGLHYRHFTDQFITPLSQRESFTLELDVMAWVRSRQQSEPHTVSEGGTEEGAAYWRARDAIVKKLDKS